MNVCPQLSDAPALLNSSVCQRKSKSSKSDKSFAAYIKYASVLSALPGPFKMRRFIDIVCVVVLSAAV